MERFITKKLLEWKNRRNRKPLILRGARQVGKTHTVLDFGKQHFKGNVHRVDLEKHPDWHRLFEKNLAAKRILSELEILLNARITPNADLLFIDEIQACPRAIMALRYFHEETPALHVIAAGSLLEFAMKEISFPVGRVQMLNMFPMSFPEFLRATGKTLAAETVLAPATRQSDTIHHMLLDELRRYFFIGGMPECVDTFMQTGKIRDAFEVQADLINAFRQDFSKYAPYSDARCLNAVLASTAKHVGRQIKYSELAEGFTNPTIKKAFDLLGLAQVIRKVPATSPAGLPLGAAAAERKFKAVLLDVGLMQHLCGVPVHAEFAKADLLGIYQGALAEQFVAQEMIAAGQSELYYWAREAKNSSAEVDYLIVQDGKIHPLEVKSGVSGKLKSLHLLLQEYPNCPAGYVFSSAHYVQLPEQKLIFLPLYYAFQKGRLN
jgi:hypothetical protein